MKKYCLFFLLMPYFCFGADFWQAIQIGDLDTVKNFIENIGMDVNKKNSFGETPLSEALANNQNHIAEYLIEKKANYKNPALIEIVINNNNFKGLMLLAEKGINLADPRYPAFDLAVITFLNRLTYQERHYGSLSLRGCLNEQENENDAQDYIIQSYHKAIRSNISNFLMIKFLLDSDFLKNKKIKMKLSLKTQKNVDKRNLYAQLMLYCILDDRNKINGILKEGISPKELNYSASYAGVVFSALEYAILAKSKNALQFFQEKQFISKSEIESERINLMTLIKQKSYLSDIGSFID